MSKLFRAYLKDPSQRLYANEENQGIYTNLPDAKKALEDLSKIRKDNEKFVIEVLKKNRNKFEVIAEYRLVSEEWIYEDLENFYTEDRYYNVVD